MFYKHTQTIGWLLDELRFIAERYHCRHQRYISYMCSRMIHHPRIYRHTHTHTRTHIAYTPQLNSFCYYNKCNRSCCFCYCVVVDVRCGFLCCLQKMLFGMRVGWDRLFAYTYTHMKWFVQKRSVGVFSFFRIVVFYLQNLDLVS